MKRLALLFHFSLFLLPSSASVPIRWTVETSRVQPATFDAYQGETLTFEAALQSYGKPLEAPSEYAFYWQTNGMGSAWWVRPCTVPDAPRVAGAGTNVLYATFSPDMDCGAKVYSCFIGLSNSIYRAAFQLRLRPSPGAVPNLIEQPPRVLDLAHTVVVNPPWPTDETISSRIRQVIDEDGITAPVSTNVVTGIISNTVDKSYVESLGISGGGGSGGTNTNDVKALINSEVGGTNALKAAVSRIPSWLTKDSKEPRGKTDLAVHPSTFTRFTWHSDDPDCPAGWVSKANAQDAPQISYVGSNRWGPIVVYGFENVNGAYGTEDALELRNVLFENGMSTSFIAWADREVVHDTLATSNGVAAAMANKADRDELQPIATVAEEAKAAANEANVWSAATYNFMTGGRTNCWFSGTNYVFGSDAATRQHFAWEDGMDAATVPCSMALWEIRDGVRQLVWDQRDWTAWYWSFKAEQMAADIQGRIDALGNSVTNAANYAWSKRYASDGTPNPDASTTFIDTPSVTLSPGMKWETVATVSGAAYWTIVGNGAVIGGTGTNAVLRIQDFEGNDIMTVTKGEHRLAWLERGEITGSMYDEDRWVCFDMLADAEPVGYFSTTLESSDFLPQTDPSCPAQYSWENIGGGKWRVHYLLKPGIQADACFAKFQVEVEGQTVIRYNAGQEISGGLIYNGVKIAPDISGTPAVGTVIQWKVVR